MVSSTKVFWLNATTDKTCQKEQIMSTSNFAVTVQPMKLTLLMHLIAQEPRIR